MLILINQRGYVRRCVASISALYTRIPKKSVCPCCDGCTWSKIL